eukprot:8639384-Pyramimonas_sp.AAC.1
MRRRCFLIKGMGGVLKQGTEPQGRLEHRAQDMLDKHELGGKSNGNGKAPVRENWAARLDAPRARVAARERASRPSDFGLIVNLFVLRLFSGSCDGYTIRSPSGRVLG